MCFKKDISDFQKLQATYSVSKSIEISSTNSNLGQHVAKIKLSISGGFIAFFCSINITEGSNLSSLFSTKILNRYLLPLILYIQIVIQIIIACPSMQNYYSLWIQVMGNKLMQSRNNYTAYIWSWNPIIKSLT